jgi:hypothetical protein
VILLVRLVILLTAWLVKTMVDEWRESPIGCVSVFVLFLIVGLICKACESC